MTTRGKRGTRVGRIMAPGWALVVVGCLLWATAAWAAGPYRQLRENNFGFAFEVPADWGVELTKTKDYLISGPAGTPAGEVAVVVQVVDKTLGGMTLESQMTGILQQVAGLPGAQVIKKGVVPMAGIQAPYFLATYPTTDTKGQTAGFAHTQIGVERGKYIFLISYSAPEPIYRTHTMDFQHLVDTFTFDQP